MENEEYNETAKRMKPSMDDNAMVKVSGEETEGEGDALVGSEQMLLEIAQIHEKINRFTQLVSELLESGKSMLKDLSNEFEERLILIHKEQLDKWEEEVQVLRLLDASNEETNAVLQDAKYLLQNVRGCLGALDLHFRDLVIDHMRASLLMLSDRDANSGFLRCEATPTSALSSDSGRVPQVPMT
ncbi:hypothetical protein ACH5RR_017544 [Cinchona calisaya]|uniref:Uncharacterized protein n=1 Tax=Cinchona calisaya TaxID=153742 RepID=A0ABD2ZIV5_9GENT